MNIENSYRLNKEQLIWSFLIASWAIIQLVLYNQSGVKTGYDSTFYLEQANGLLQFTIPEGRGIWYISYIAFLAVFLGLGLPLVCAIFVQIMLSLVALHFLYKSAKAIAGNKKAGIIAAALYIFWIPIQEWNVFLYTESLFTSCLIISFWCLLKVKTLRGFLLVFPLILFTIFIRPTGFGFFLALLAYFVPLILKKIKLKVYKRLVIVSLFSLSIVLITFMLESYQIIESYAKAEIIYPNINLGLAPPDDLIVPHDNQLNIFQLFYFAYHNPIYFLKLCFIKLFLFFGNIKPYFSLFHNLYIIILLYPIYFFAYRGHKKLQDQPTKWFFSVYIFTQGLTIMLMTENWDGRFLVPVLPFIFILASVNISKSLIFLKQLKIEKVN